jgi:hypothetical protein
MRGYSRRCQPPNTAAPEGGAADRAGLGAEAVGTAAPESATAFIFRKPFGTGEVIESELKNPHPQGTGQCRLAESSKNGPKSRPLSA